MVTKNFRIILKNNIKTFIAIAIFIFLGIGFFIGMKNTVPDLEKTVNDYYNTLNYMDMEITSSIGFNLNEIEQLSNIEGINKIEYAHYSDYIIPVNNKEYVFRIYTYSSDNNINNIELIKGNYPKNKDEIVLESSLINSFKIGSKINLDGNNIDKKELTVVGFAKSPLYISNDKGSTNLLSGKIKYYGFINIKNVIIDNYNTLYLKTSSNYDNVIEKLQNEGKKITNERYSTTIDEYKNKIEEYKKEYNNKKQEVNEEISYAEEKIKSLDLEIESAYDSLPTESEVKKQINEKKNSLSKYKEALNDAKSRIDKATNEYNNAVSQLNSAKSTLETSQNDYNKRKREYEEIIAIYDSRISRYNNGESLENYKNCNAIEECEASKYLIEATIKLLNSSVATAERKIRESEEQLSSKSKELEQAKSEYNKANEKYKEAQAYANSQNAKEIIANLKKQIDNKKEELEKYKSEYVTKSQTAYDELEQASKDIDSLEDYIKYISNSDWNISTRYNNTQYSKYINDIDRIKNISNIFPIIFFVVAILITLTNITRIIEKDRTTIGLFKALGYSNKNIITSYILFSLTSSLIGCILGILVGISLIPTIFYKVYSLMYILPKMTYIINYKLVIISILISILITVISTFISCYKTICEKPVDLLRGKTVSKGKRVIFEKLSIWNKLNFSKKVTIRNIFKYPKRIILTVIGVSGCISLIVSGFNLKYGISSIIPIQFGELFKVDVQVFFRDSVMNNEIEKERERYNNMDEIEGSILLNLSMVNINDDKTNVYLAVPEDNDLLSDYVYLSNNNEKIELDNDSAIISKKIANKLNIKKNDIIKVKEYDGDIIELKIKDICDNYVDNYIYVSKKYYKSITNENVKYNSLLASFNKSVDEEKLSRKLNENNLVSYLTYTSTSKGIYNNVNKTLDYIVYVLVISACILAVVVLFNLNTLNIEERKREIATLEVLGFNRKEVNKYVEDEMKIFIVIGSIIGLFFGYILSNILINSCELENLLYNYKINELYNSCINNIYSNDNNISYNKKKYN